MSQPPALNRDITLRRREIGEINPLTYSVWKAPRVYMGAKGAAGRRPSTPRLDAPNPYALYLIGRPVKGGPRNLNCD